MEFFNEQQIEQLVTEIFRRLALRLGGDGHRGPLLTLFSGATVGLPQAIEQLRWCSLQGFCQQLCFSAAAEAIYGKKVREQLQGFPNISELDEANWLGALTEAKAVLVPMLSLNTASKVALLVADSMPSNLILHGISLGKPVVAASNGADPSGFHWARRAEKLPVAPAFTQAIQERLQTLHDYGCLLTDVATLGSALLKTTSPESDAVPPPRPSEPIAPTPTTPVQISGHLVSTGHIRQAHRLGVDILLRHDSVVTPLAKEMAASLGVKLQHNPLS
ncbi:hypothetical protein JWJ90_12585 [Desulfobulbus rhabdoformis]|uniref:hypothetical protein n=1 Tax=Desulfobulbus rhabdoformis TaxID=34032 RepID=UPI0019648349|nr:hypothetical protein [Desulfobulbus rhabdoformis]MBM9615115.1 hypothetical protein [Desulfobulbus rhabdoformis]